MLHRGMRRLCRSVATRTDFGLTGMSRLSLIEATLSQSALTLDWSRLHLAAQSAGAFSANAPFLLPPVINTAAHGVVRGLPAHHKSPQRLKNRGWSARVWSVPQSLLSKPCKTVVCTKQPILLTVYAWSLGVVINP